VDRMDYINLAGLKTLLRRLVGAVWSVNAMAASYGDSEVSYRLLFSFDFRLKMYFNAILIFFFKHQCAIGDGSPRRARSRTAKSSDERIELTRFVSGIRDG
jgi:hypothetical protein